MSKNLKLPYKIEEKYCEELSDINEIINRLENRRIYGIDGNVSKGDGSLETNIKSLRNKINSLLTKIQNGSDSIDDKIAEAFVSKQNK